MKQLRILKQITNRESDSLDKYLVEIGKVDMITAEEEVNLARRIRDGDAAALDKLTRANLRFVVSVAKQYQNRGLSLSDLINEGNLGLIKAGQRFDETRGFKFISYAVWWIRQGIIMALAEQSRIVRLPINRVGVISKMSKAFADLEQELQRDPTAFELAGRLELSPDEIQMTMNASQKSVSADAPSHFDEHTTLIESLTGDTYGAPDSSLMRDALKEEIQNVLARLTVREREIVVLCFGLHGQEALTLEQVGIKLSLSSERVRQIKDKATRKLKNSNHAQVLRNYLG